MDETVEVLGCVAKRVGEANYQARTPLGVVAVGDGAGRADLRAHWYAIWRPKGQRRVGICLASNKLSAADAAREATRRLRAIQRTCARAGAV